MPNDDVYRIGGDEFIVVSNDFDKDIIISKLNKLNKLPLYRTKIYEKFSAGVVINDRGISVSTAQEKADKLLYDIKNVSNVYYKFNK